MKLPSLHRKIHFTLVALQPPVSDSSGKEKWNMCKLTHFNSTNSGQLYQNIHDWFIRKIKSTLHKWLTVFFPLILDWSRGYGWVPRPHSCMARGHRKPLCLGHIAPFMLSTLTHWHEAPFCSFHQNNPGQSWLQQQGPNTIPECITHANTKRAGVIMEALTVSLGVCESSSRLVRAGTYFITNYLSKAQRVWSFVATFWITKIVWLLIFVDKWLKLKWKAGSEA